MSLLTRLLGRRGRSELEQFIGQIGPDVSRAAQAAFESASDPTMRFSAGLSVTVLSSVGSLAESLKNAIRTLPTGDGGPPPHLYDVAVFEGAAFAHYFLLRDYLHRADEDDEWDGGDDDDYEDDEDGLDHESVYHSGLKNAAYLTQQIVAGRTSFSGGVTLMNRVQAYAATKRPFSEDAALFSVWMTRSVAESHPASGAYRGGFSDQLLAVPIAAFTRQWCVTILPALQETAQRLHHFDLATRP